LNIELLIKGLNGVIPGEISVKDFCMIADTDKYTAKKVFESFAKNGIEVLDGDVINFKAADKLKAAIFVLKKGASINEVAKYLNWKDFEGLVFEILRSKGFSVIKNLTMKKPRMEIDVIGINLGVAILIDCKHWKRQSPSSLKNAVKKQISRVKHYVSKTQGAVGIPAIVTLYEEKLQFIDNVPIVPINQFTSFVDEFYGNLEKLKTITS